MKEMSNKTRIIFTEAGDNDLLDKCKILVLGGDGGPSLPHIKWYFRDGRINQYLVSPLTEVFETYDFVCKNPFLYFVPMKRTSRLLVS